MLGLGISFLNIRNDNFEKSAKVKINIACIISLLISWRLFLSSHWWIRVFASQQVNVFDTSLINCTAFATAKNKRQSRIQSQFRKQITSYKGIWMKNNLKKITIYSRLMYFINIFFANGSLQGTNTYFIYLPFCTSHFRFLL